MRGLFSLLLVAGIVAAPGCGDSSKPQAVPPPPPAGPKSLPKADGVGKGKAHSAGMTPPPPPRTNNPAH